ALPILFRDKKVVIGGGGDSALDSSIFFADVAKSVTLVHSRNQFRGALDSVEKVQELKKQAKINLITPAEVVEIHGVEHVEAVTLSFEGGTSSQKIETDYFIP